MCKYKDIFGKPGTGVHNLRLFNIAVVDVLFTIIGSVIIAQFIKISSKPILNIAMISLFFFLLGILLHRFFCVRTTVDKMLFS